MKDKQTRNWERKEKYDQSRQTEMHHPFFSFVLVVVVSVVVVIMVVAVVVLKCITVINHPHLFFFLSNRQNDKFQPF